MALGDGVSAITSLGVTFGGFSPTVIDGVAASKEAVEKFEKLNSQRKEALKRRRELEFARASKPKKAALENGDIWDYVIVDESLVRLLKCESDSENIIIPGQIEGMDVFAIGSDAISGNDKVEEIICPDTVESIGACAFRQNIRLKRIVFPSLLADFQSSWVSHCENLEEMVLPGLLDEISLAIFSNSSLKRLVIGNSAYSIEPGAFQETKLERIEIDPENPFIKTDGAGIYSADGLVLLALALPIERYEVEEGCRFLAKKSCYRNGALKHLICPESMEQIDEFALAHSGVLEFRAPANLKTIEEKAFLHCKDLKAVYLNDGLESIKDSAFAESGLSALHIPASIETIGSSITARTHVVHSGLHCSLTIDERCEKLFLDGQGGLYRREQDGPHLLQLADPDMTHFRVAEGTVTIDEYAFAFHNAIETVSIPDSVTKIGRSAFRICRKLRHVDLPDSIESIGSEAFLDTELEDFRVPAKLRELGANALVTYGAHHGQEMPSLSRVTVAPGNKSFYVTCGMLCRRVANGANVVVFTSSEREVVFPEEVTHIEEYAFNNARGIDFLSLNANLATIGTSGLSTWCWIRHIHVDRSEPVEGRTEFDFFFPDTPRSLHCISVGIGGASWVNVPGIMAQYDNCIVSARDYNAPRSSDNISAYDQAKLILGRFADPIMLTPMKRGLFERLLRTYLVEICVDIARHDDRTAFEELIERGFVNADNVDAIIERVNVLQDAAMTAYLLEVKRLRFTRAAIDFDL